MSACRKERRRTKNLDTEVYARFALKRQIIKCSNGHYNSKAAKFCWICGAALSLKGFVE